jgi:glycine cleavage system H protein
MRVLDDRQYAQTHEWVKWDGTDKAEIGISDHAQSELGDLVFVNLPQVGDKVEVGKAFGDLESVKAVSDVYSPVTGVVSAINEALLDAPEQINVDPYTAWFIKVEKIEDHEDLMDHDQYELFCAREEQ